MLEGARPGQPIGPRKFKLLKRFSIIVIVSSSAATLVMVDYPYCLVPAPLICKYRWKRHRKLDWPECSCLPGKEYVGCGTARGLNYTGFETISTQAEMR